MKLFKILNYIHRSFILKLCYINSKKYMKKYKSYLKKRGMVFLGNGPRWIANDVYFDGTDYGLITIGDGSLISRKVIFLTHDYSFITVSKNIDKFFNDSSYRNLTIDEKNFLEKNKIYIGNNTFIGMRATILPGTSIGDNCIIGAGAVVKGKIEDNTIVVGNPAKKINNTSDWVVNKIKKEKL